MINIEFKSIKELIKAFPDEQTCISHLEQLRWNGNVVSPFDETSKVYTTARGYKCKNTGKYFNVRTATLFDNTKIELQTWFLAIYLITGHKKGISSLQLGRDLNVTQKTAWFMLQRIRNCFGIDAAETEIDNDNKLGGSGVIVEVDETIVGGKVKNMNNKSER
jgi:transposase-like protein